jgi:hypothetical protein
MSAIATLLQKILFTARVGNIVQLFPLALAKLGRFFDLNVTYYLPVIDMEFGSGIMARNEVRSLKPEGMFPESVLDINQLRYHTICLDHDTCIRRSKARDLF